MGLLAGAIVAFILIPILGLALNLPGVLIAGFLAGLVAGGGALRGAAAAFLGGLFIGFILSGLLVLLGVSVAFLHPVAAGLAGLAILAIIVGSVIVGAVAAVGGAIGGLLRRD